MKIKKISLENVRSHKESEINFSDGVTVFTGRTGSGKSTILMGVEYGLFGGTNALSNSMLLRRNATEGSILIEFEHRGDIYKVVRGFKKTKSGVNTDSSKLEIQKNNEKFPIMDRVNDMNEKICEILGYQNITRAKELFEVTSYTRQDEIRKLISMKPETRQEYVDNILQLSKYKRTWENLKPIVRHFESEIEKLSGIVNSSKSISDDLVKLNEGYKNIKENLEKSLKKYYDILEKAKSHADILNNKMKEMVEYEKINNRYTELSGILKMSERNLKDFSDEIVFIKIDIDELKKILVSFPENAESKYEIRGKLASTIDNLKFETGKLNDELSKLRNNLHANATCPLCKQKISESHLSGLENEYLRQINEIMERRKEYRTKLEMIEKEIKEVEKSKVDMERLKKIEMMKLEKERHISELNEKTKLIKEQISELDIQVSKYKMMREEVEKLRNDEKKILEEKASLSRETEFMKTRLEEINDEIKSKNGKIQEFEKTKQRLEKIEKLNEKISKLRDDIRDIREVVRAKFIQDFRHHFQNKFEDIRRSETEYYVDIKNNYEPFSFTKKGEEVPIDTLSGGEKTSVALAYRLALSDIAAQMEGVSPSEVLILDEPTVGFDKEDIKVLPEMLRNIRSIPQIVIVTHEEELKNAADYNYVVDKKAGVSTITLEA